MMKTIRLKLILVGLLILLGGIPLLAQTEQTLDSDITHRMMMLVIQLGVILFAARLGNILFEKIKLPGVLGELCAGIFIGPYLLGAIHLPGFPHGIFPIFSGGFAISPELYGISTVASILLLFMVGLETDFKLFLRYSVTGSLVGVGGVLFSFIFGDVVAVLFSRLIFNRAIGFMAPQALFLGIISTATSVGITARILSEKRKLDSPEGVSILAGAVIDDVLGIILLAVGLGVISASKASGNIDWGHIGIIAIKAFGIWIAATAIGLITSQKISVLLKWFRSQSSIAIMALGLALILAGLFEEARLAMIIGAYVMGLSLSKTDISHVIRENLASIYAFMVPIFFTVMGMLVNIHLLASWHILVFGLVYTGMAALAKILGCGLPALLCNFNLKGALRVGVGMLPRGEVALIIAGVGLAGGLLSTEVFGVAVLMTLLTTIIAPPILVGLFHYPGSGLRKVVKAEEKAELAFDFPTYEIATLMVNNLTNAFESEGFFVHTLSRREQIFQIRKDDIVIGFQHSDDRIIFDCNDREIPLVNTAMFEVLAEFEATIRKLKKPVDSEAIARKLQDQIPVKFERKLLAAYLSKEVLRPRLTGINKKEIIEELLNVLKSQGLIRDFEQARKAVFAREEGMSTGMQFGIAIPHGRTDAVDRLICAIGLKPEGVDFDSIDRQPAQIFVLVLSPESASAPHMHFMSMISQALDEEGRRELLLCQTTEEMLAVLTGQNKQNT
jgi:Kef-type K+ transport system membrane component KefB/mannitol/fructose-specific phosphotransferase system IIA component (Ntr-type)